MPWKKDHPSWPLNPPGAIYQELPEPLAPLPVPSRPRPSRPSRAESHWAMVVPQFGIAFSWGPHNSNFTIWFMADISKLTRVYKPTFTSLGGTTLWVIKHNHRDFLGFHGIFGRIRHILDPYISPDPYVQRIQGMGSLESNPICHVQGYMGRFHVESWETNNVFLEKQLIIKINGVWYGYNKTQAIYPLVISKTMEAMVHFVYDLWCFTMGQWLH